MRRARAAAAAAAAPAAHGQQPPSANNTSTSTANNTGNATAAPPPPPPPPPDQLRRTPSGGATAAAAAAGRRPGVRVTGGGGGDGSASIASSKSRQSSSSRSHHHQQQRRTTKVERRMHNNSNNNNASSASRDLDVASASASSSSFGSQSQTSRSTHSAASASRSARSQQQQQQHNTSGTSRTHPGRTRDRVGARANAAAAHSSLPQQQQQHQQAMRPQPSRPGPQSQPQLPSQQQHHHHHHHQQQERKATIAQAPDWLYTSNASGVSGVSALSDSTERTDNRLIGLARRLSADGGSADAYSEEDAAGASNPMPTGTGTGTGTGRPIAATRTTTTRSTTSTDNTDGGAVTTEQMMFTIGLNDVATARTTGSSTTSGSANAGDDRRSSFVSVDSSMFSGVSGISGMTGYSEVTQKMDNTMGNTIARRAIAEVERELMIDEKQEEAEEAGIQVAGGSGGGTKSSTVDVLQIAQTLERDESGILTGFDSNDTDASATVQEQPMQKAVQQQQQQHNDLHSSMRMSAVFGRSLGPDALALGGVEDTIPEEDLSDGHGSASGNDHRSSAGSLQSSVHLERQLRDLHVAQQELRRREEELKREVLVQREVERRRSSEGSGRGGSAVRRNTSSSRGSKSSIGTSNGPSSPSPPPATATADASGSNKSLGSAARRHSISATASQESLNVDMAPPPGELRRTSSTSNIPNDALMMSGQSLTVGDVGDMQRFEKADEAFADGRDAMQEMDYASAKKAFERALFLYRSCPEEVVEKSVRADIHHALGTIELETGGNDYESALINLRTARRMRATIGDKLGEAMSLKDCARLHATMGQAPNSALNFQECMEIMISELGEENPRVHEFLIDIGATAKQLGMEKDAIEQFEVALDIVRLRRSMKPNDFQTKICLCSVLHSLGILQFHTGDFQQSLKHLQDLMDLRSTIDATPTAQDAGILNLISKIHRKLGNFEMGHTSAKRALDTSRQQRKEAARASHSSGRSLGSLQNSHASEDVSAGVSSGRSSEDPSVYIHLAEDNTIVSELDSTFSPVNAQANQQAPEMRYLPFILVSDECHKKQIRRDTLRANMMKVYFTSSKARSEACDILYDVGEMMEFLADDAKQILSSPTSSEKQQMEVMENLLFDGCNVSVSMVDEYAPNAYGIEISDRLFWEGFVMPHDLSEFQSDFVSNSARRQSNPDAMVQNLAHLQSTGRHPLAAIPCVLQLDEDSPMAPHMLVVAFEKAGVGVHAADPDNWPPTSSTVSRYGAGA